MAESIEFLKQGGWPMVPLGLCSVLALSIIFERLFALRKSKVLEYAIQRLVENYSGEASAETALRLCEGLQSPFAKIVEEVIRGRHLDRAQALNTLEAVGRTQVGRLERGLTLLEIIAGISPLIGLLGTVLGMVTVFDAISAEGMGNPQVLSEGISKALITTVAGLSVAIPALAFHSLLSRRVEELATVMHDRAVNFATRIHAFQRSDT